MSFLNCKIAVIPLFVIINMTQIKCTSHERTDAFKLDKYTSKKGCKSYCLVLLKYSALEIWICQTNLRHLMVKYIEEMVEN